MEDLLKLIKQQLQEAERAVKEAEEALHLAELMGIDVAQARLRFEAAKKRYQQLKAGFEKYLAEKGLRL